MLAEDTKGLVKLIVLKDGHIVGASLMGPNVTDYVAELALAIEKRICVTALTHVIHPHPTFNEIIWEAARSALSKLTAEKIKRKKKQLIICFYAKPCLKHFLFLAIL
nr:hypothetical protein [Mycoplasmopsis bovis]